MVALPEKTLLAAPQDKAAVLYYAYHLLTQVAGLSAQAGALDHREATRALWEQLGDSFLLDIGSVYALWDTLIHDAKTPASGPGDVAAAQKLMRFCARVDQLIKHLTIWSPMQRWARAIANCELRWQRDLQQLSKIQPQLVSKLNPIYKSSKERSKQLAHIAGLYRDEQAAMRGESAVGELLLEEAAS